jgi:hypothetical protein
MREGPLIAAVDCLYHSCSGIADGYGWSSLMKKLLIGNWPIGISFWRWERNEGRRFVSRQADPSPPRGVPVLEPECKSRIL